MSKYIRTYQQLCPDDQVFKDDPRRKAIMAEMRGVHRARSDKDAVAVIDWWKAWPNPQHQTPLEFVRAARKLMRT